MFTLYDLFAFFCTPPKEERGKKRRSGREKPIGQPERRIYPAARRRRKSEIRSSKSETNPNGGEWGNGETGSRDVSSPAASNLDYGRAGEHYVLRCLCLFTAITGIFDEAREIAL
jgi:hypothetical protein